MKKSIKAWYKTDSIDWKVFLEMIDTLDIIIKKNRNPKNRTRGGWYWPEQNYNASAIFRERFNTGGKVEKSYREILENCNISVINHEKFIASIIQSMLRIMGHPLRRRKWNLNTKINIR